MVRSARAAWPSATATARRSATGASLVAAIAYGPAATGENRKRPSASVVAVSGAAVRPRQDHGRAGDRLAGGIGHLSLHPSVLAGGGKGDGGQGDQ